MPDIDYIRGEIARMRVQVGRQRREILQLQRAGIPTASAEALLERMLTKIDILCAERDKLRVLEPSPMKGKVLGVNGSPASPANREYFLNKPVSVGPTKKATPYSLS